MNLLGEALYAFLLLVLWVGAFSGVILVSLLYAKFLVWALLALSAVLQ